MQRSFLVPHQSSGVHRAWKIGPALAVGCTVVLKPSELTPLPALVCHSLDRSLLPAADVAAGGFRLSENFGALC